VIPNATAWDSEKQCQPLTGHPVDTPLVLAGKTNLLLEPCLNIKLPSFYQDRLGTNIGKALKKRVAFFLGFPAMDQQGVFEVSKRSFLKPSICTSVLFTKTGSG
jgi:hypothetical protein